MINIFQNYKQQRQMAQELHIAEILHDYTTDLQRLTVLRDKARTDEEAERYTNIVDVAQKTLEHLLEIHDAA